jgi:hypothetical protein
MPAATLSDFVGRSAGPRREKLQDWQSGELKNADAFKLRQDMRDRA